MGEFSKKIKQRSGIGGGRINPGKMIYDHLVIVPSEYQETYIYGEFGKSLPPLYRLNTRHEDDNTQYDGKHRFGIILAVAQKKYGPTKPMLGYVARQYGYDASRVIHSIENTRYYPAMMEQTLMPGDTVLMDHMVTEEYREVKIASLLQHKLLDKNIDLKDKKNWKVYVIRDQEIFGYVRDRKWYGYADNVFVTPGTLMDAMKLGLAKTPANLDIEFAMNNAWHSDKKIALAKVVVDFQGFGSIGKIYKRGDWVLVKLNTFQVFENETFQNVKEGEKIDELDLSNHGFVYTISVLDIITAIESA